jgi:hypothetical protein
MSTQGFLHDFGAIIGQNGWQTFNALVLSICPRNAENLEGLPLSQPNHPNETQIPLYRRSGNFHGARCFCAKRCLFFR